MKKVYFACSIRGGRDDQSIYAALASIIKQHAILLTEIFADNKLTAKGMNKPNREIWTTDMSWIGEADAIIAEVTNPSLGVGYEIAKAEELNKPILCLYRPQAAKSLSAMIAGSPKLQIVEYEKIESIKSPVEKFIRELQ